MDNCVKFHRDEDGQCRCYVKENGEWVFWDKSELWNTEENKKLPEFLKNDHGTRLFQLAVKARYKVLDLNEPMD